jgi:hypothetical protein
MPVGARESAAGSLSDCVGAFYTALRRRPTNPRPTSAEPSSISEAGSGTRGVEVACKTAGKPLTCAYHRS